MPIGVELGLSIGFGRFGWLLRFDRSEIGSRGSSKKRVPPRYSEKCLCRLLSSKASTEREIPAIRKEMPTQMTTASTPNSTG